MHYSQETSSKTLQHQLVTAYIHHVSDLQPDGAQWMRNHPQSEPITASWQVGQACLAITEGAIEDGIQLLDTVQRNMSPIIEDTNRDAGVRRDGRHVSAMASLFRAAIDPSVEDSGVAVEQQLKVMHDLNVTAAQDISVRLKETVTAEESRKLRGDLGEEIVVGGLSRYVRSDFIALRTLPHHDGSGKPSFEPFHHDAAIVYPAGQTFTVRQLQVKSFCLGFCIGLPEEIYEEKREQYAANIYFISTHCDIPYSPKQARHLLVQEPVSKAGSEQLQQLTTMTNTLFAAATSDDPLRRGTYGQVDWNKNWEELREAWQVA